MKNLLSLIIFTIFSTNLFAVASYTCNGELVSNLNGATTTASASYIEGVDTSVSSGDGRYFLFTPDADGVVNVHQQNKDRLVNGYNNHKLEIGTSCAASDIYSGSGTTNDSHSFSVESGTTYYVRVIEANTQNKLNFYIDFNFLDSTTLASYYTCANPKPFSLRTNYVIAGDLLAIGNSNICADDDKNGVCDSDQYKRNDTSNIIYIDSSSSSAVSSEPSSLFNTSAANLSLPAGATVKWAGLYWQGEVWDINVLNTSRLAVDGITPIENGSDGQARRALANKIKFKVPGGTYQDLTADEHYYFFVKRNEGYSDGYRGINRYEEHYQSFKDVTSLVQNAGTGDYWVANLQATVGKLRYPGVEAAWSLQIVYEYPNSEPRSIAINDGYVGLYGSAVDGVNYVNEINSLYGTSCSTNTEDSGVYAYEVSFDVSGFITPKESGFNTDLSIFVTESDPDSGSDPSLPEELSVTKSDGSKSTVDGPALGETDAWAYSITNKDGSNNLNRTPSYLYPIGMTIKNYSKTDLLSTEQTSTTVTFKTDSDRLIIGVVGFATDLRKPKLCYDYAYSQYDRYLTEEYDATVGPKLSGTFTENEPIQVKYFIRNEENSDILAENFSMDILDINTSQAIYIRNTTQLTLPSNTTVLDIPDTQLSVSDSYIKDLDIGTLDSNQYYYAYFKLDPQDTELDMALNAKVDYNITLAAGSETITIPYSVYIDTGMPICGDGGISLYTPERGMFNIVHNNNYSGANQYYNIPTQVTSRPGNFKVIATDPDDLDTLSGVSTVVFVELIDIGAFHDEEASCQELGSSISEKVQIRFDGNVTSAQFTQSAINASLANNINPPIANAAEFYKTAKENVAFRLSYLVNGENNDSLLQTEVVSATKTKILNFTELIQDIGQCVQTVDAPAGASGNWVETNNISTACGNAGGTGVSDAYLQSCMECLFGHNTRRVCSRDNFALRPEAFMLHIDDQNQSDPTSQIDITTLSHSGSIGATAPVLNLAAGYDYNIEINATNHVNNTASDGYTKSFTDPDIQYLWEPNVAFAANICNDEHNKSVNTDNLISLYNGEADANTSVNQVGKYRLTLLDTTWTSVDSNPLYMQHHTGNHFIPPATSLDCLSGSSNTQLINAATMNGCNISSNHLNPQNSVQYNDYSIIFHPYEFDVSGITPGIGLSNQTPGINSYVYMADINQDQDENMSYHLNGGIIAVGENNLALTNFVEGCYSEPLDLNISRSTLTLPVAYRYRFHSFENNGTEIGTSVAVDLNNSTVPILLPTTIFPKDLNGTAVTELYLNYDRDKNRTVNPQEITFIEYNLKCTTTANCTFNADMINNKTTEGTKDLNSSITLKHYYGRTNGPRQTFTGNTGTGFIYYEVYCSTDATGVCNKNLLADGPTSTNTDDPRWFVNNNHLATDSGTIGVVTQKGASSLVNATNINEVIGEANMILNYTGTTLPYKTTMENNASTWLIYNKYDDTANTNEFQVEFLGGPGSWAGVQETNSTTNSNATSKTNRRSMW